ncbi:hypothetical protein BT69DRAFT_1355686 [Atractiella rhizophila]|nr:hypothetical protein BT69DRAFT_1355686 [Atractiella rhizophila]
MSFVTHLLSSVRINSGTQLASLFSLYPPSRSNLNQYEFAKLQKPWYEMAEEHAKCMSALKEGEDAMGDRERERWKEEAWNGQRGVVNALLRYLQTSSRSTSWTLPLLKTVCSDFKRISIETDDFSYSCALENGNYDPEEPRWPKTTEASRIISKVFNLCTNDRTQVTSDLPKSTECYFFANLLIKMYHKMDTLHLFKNISATIAAADIAPVLQHTCPKADKVTYLYYMGLIAFLKEDFATAERELSLSFVLCHRRSIRNRELILDLLIPLRLLRGSLPSKNLLKSFHRLKILYEPFVEAYKQGNPAAWDQALERGRARLGARGTLLLVMVARQAVVRRLVKKIWIVNNRDSRQRLDIILDVFREVNSPDMDADEVECVLANMIRQGLIKGYLSHPHQLMVLSKDNPFPKMDNFISNVPGGL